MISYLKNKRGVDGEIIDFCVKTGRLYKSLPYHNVVFVGMDGQNTPKYAALRGIDTDFKGEAAGSDKRYAFCVPSERPSEVLHLYESAIDLLSYATLLKMHGKDWRDYNLLSLAGVYRPSRDVENSALPSALTQFLQDVPQIRQISLHLDNDEAGVSAATAITLLLQKQGYDVTNRPPIVGKDCNDTLLHYRSVSANKSKERSLAR